MSSTRIRRRWAKRWRDGARCDRSALTFLQILVGVLAAVAIGIFGTLLLIWRRLVKVEADVALLSSQFGMMRAP